MVLRKVGWDNGRSRRFRHEVEEQEWEELASQYTHGISGSWEPPPLFIPHPHKR